MSTETPGTIPASEVTIPSDLPGLEGITNVQDALVALRDLIQGNAQDIEAVDRRKVGLHGGSPLSLGWVGSQNKVQVKADGTVRSGVDFQ